MGYVPNDAEWYLADIVLEIQVEGDVDSLFHVNLTLIHASSPEEAYQLSLEQGKASEVVYPNTDGKLVRVTFRGLRDLHVVHEPLEHGSELLYEEMSGLSETQAKTLTRTKNDLALFRK